MSYRSQFFDKLLSQIRVKEAREQVRLEMSHHIEKSKQALLQKGLTELEAENKAIRQMGDPIILGTEMNKLHKPIFDWKLLSLFGLAIMISFLPFYMMEAVYLPLFKQLIAIFIGIGIIFAGMHLDYRKLQRYGLIFYGLGIGLLFFVYSSGIFTYQVAGNTYMRTPIFAGVDSSITLPILLLAFASITSKKYPMWKLTALCVLPILLFCSASSYVNAMIYTVMSFCMIAWSVRGHKKSMLQIAGVFTASIIALLFAVAQSARGQRLVGFFINKSNFEEFNYRPTQISKLLYDAPLFGMPRLENYSVLPDIQTNFVLVLLTHQLGWISFAIILFILYGLLGRMLWMKSKVKDAFGEQLIIGGCMLYGVPLTYNVLMILGLLPISGVWLPLISYGTIVNWIYAFIIGLVLSVFRRKSYLMKSIKSE